MTRGSLNVLVTYELDRRELANVVGYLRKEHSESEWEPAYLKMAKRLV